MEETNKNKAGKHLIAENEQKAGKSFVWLRLLSVLSVIASVAYLIYPGDFDKGVIGRVDDFLFFMAAFCFVYSQFMGKKQARASLLLAVISVLFCFMGAVWLLLLIFLN